VIVNAAGFILTNDHVIERAGKITVKLADGTEHTARIIGRDPQTDLAVIKINASQPLPPARMGDSERLKVGDWVLAIGSPFGLDQTVTAGIISAKHRETGSNDQTPFQQFLQTDAAINPGNSGGPLVSLAGEVVGINTQIATRRGVYEGIGLALPSATAVDVYNQIVTNGRVRRGFLGIQLGVLTPQISRQNKITDSSGVLVQSVTSDDSPAARAGIQSGDVIRSVNGQMVKTGPELTRLIASLPVGSTANITYIRDGVERTAAVKLEERQDEFQGQLNFQKPRPDQEEGHADEPKAKRGLGLSVKTLTPEAAKQRGLEGVRGVYVTEVEPGSVADENGLQPGDVIIWVNYREIATLDDFQRITSTLKSGDDLILRILRKERGLRRLAEIISFTIP
jgi:serine protease Do